MSIRTITVMQPYASFIIHGDDSGDRKDVENRTWPTNHRGPLLIHAGVGQRYIRTRGFNIARASEFVFGAIVGVVDVTECFGLITHLDALRGPRPDDLRWADGPWCWRLANPRPLAKPVPCKGRLGLWTPDAETMRAVMEQIGDGRFDVRRDTMTVVQPEGGKA